MKPTDFCPCGEIWTEVMYALDGPHCPQDDGERFLRGYAAECRKLNADLVFARYKEQGLKR